jgi:hypothetical protein
MAFGICTGNTDYNYGLSLFAQLPRDSSEALAIMNFLVVWTYLDTLSTDMRVPSELIFILRCRVKRDSKLIGKESRLTRENDVRGF